MSQPHAEGPQVPPAHEEPYSVKPGRYTECHAVCCVVEVIHAGRG